MTAEQMDVYAGRDHQHAEERRQSARCGCLTLRGVLCPKCVQVAARAIRGGRVLKPRTVETPTGVHPIVELCRSERIRRKWSLAQAAVALGVARSTVAAWETGRRWPPDPKLRAYAELMGLDLAALL